MNSSPKQRKGSTYMSGETAQEVQNGRVHIRENRSGSKEAATETLVAPTTPQADRRAELALPDATPNLPEAARHRDRRRTVIVAIIGVLALLVAVVLVAVGSSKTESPVVPLDSPAAGSYAGDWKDALIEQPSAAVDGPVDVRAPAGDHDAVTQRLQNEGLVPAGPRQPSDDNVMGGGGRPAGDHDAVTQRLQNEGLVPAGPRQPNDSR